MTEITDRKLVDACIQVYNKRPKLKGFKTRNIVVDNSKATLFYDDKNLIIALCGSDDIKDWYSNIKFMKTGFTGNSEYGKVHSGFYNNYKEIRDRLFREYDNLKKGRTVYVTGHSLGGAMAHLFCTVKKVDTLVTIGCPRVGNKKWKKYFLNWNKTTEIIRYVNDQDVVTKMPKLFYKHVNNAIYFDKNKDIVSKRPGCWLLFFSRRIRGIYDHDKIEYKEAVHKNKL